MPILLTDSQGTPIPQYLSENGNTFEYSKGSNGAIYVQDINMPLKNVSDLKAASCYSVQLVSQTGDTIDLSTFELTTRVVGDVNIIHGTPTDKQIFERGAYTGDKMSNSVYIGQSDCLMIYLNVEAGHDTIKGVDIYTNVNNLDVLIYSFDIASVLPSNIIGVAKYGSTLPNVLHHTPPHSFKVRVRCSGTATYDLFMQVL